MDFFRKRATFSNDFLEKAETFLAFFEGAIAQRESQSTTAPFCRKMDKEEWLSATILFLSKYDKKCIDFRREPCYYNARDTQTPYKPQNHQGGAAYASK